MQVKADIYVSPTQVRCFKRCRRKWFFGWPMHIKEPQSPAAELGDLIHGQCETAVKTKSYKCENARAQLGLDHMIARTRNLSKVVVERHIDAPLNPDGKIRIVGKVDWTESKRIPARLMPCLAST